MDLGDVELRGLSEKLGSEWHKLATYLGFKRAKIQQFEIESEHRGIDSIIFDMLVTWREQQPRATNFRVGMKSALEKCGRVDLAESITPESPKAALDKIYSILESKLESNSEQFQEAILTFYKELITMTTDSQISSALAAFGKHSKVENGTKEDEKLVLEKKKLAVKKWQPVMKISQRGEEGDSFVSVISVALHRSGDIAVIDKNNDFWKGREGSPRVYGFTSKGTRTFVLTSTDPKENPVGKLEYAQGIGVTEDGKYIVADGVTPVKVFDIKGQYVGCFSTLTDTEESIRMRPKCVAIGHNGDILIGDFLRKVVTVHRGSDFAIIHEVYVSLEPVDVAVTSKEHVIVSNWENGKVMGYDYSGDELFTIEPLIWGKSTKPHALVCDENDNILLAVMELDGKSGCSKSNTGHVHQYDVNGDFIKCVLKGVRYPIGIAICTDVLAIANKDFVQIYKTF